MMDELSTVRHGVLYWIAYGSSAATRVVEPGVRLAQAIGWDVCVITTPYGQHFINVPLLAQLCGHPARSDYKMPDTPEQACECALQALDITRQTQSIDVLRRIQILSDQLAVKEVTTKVKSLKRGIQETRMALVYTGDSYGQ